jgi:hypothetical protein
MLGEQLQFMLRAMMRNTLERLACSTRADISVVWQRCASRHSWQAGSTGSSIQHPHKLGIHVFAAVKKTILAYAMSSQYETERQNSRAPSSIAMQAYHVIHHEPRSK